jgi:hypothetical protein
MAIAFYIIYFTQIFQSIQIDYKYVFYVWQIIKTESIVAFLLLLSTGDYLAIYVNLHYGNM